MTTAAVWKWVLIGSAGVADVWMQVPHPVQVLVMIMGLDIVSGLIAGAVTGTLNSSIMAKGLWKKLAVFPLLALLHLTEKPLALPFEFESMAAVAFIVYEAMSVVENAGLAGVPIPKVVVSFLAKAKITTATPEDIKREFYTSALSVGKSIETVNTPGSQPDMKVEKTATLLEEVHVTPIIPPAIPADKKES